MADSTPKYAWMNGEIIPWADAKVHVRTDAFMRGATIFEGIRAYSSADKSQLYLFKNAEHMDRMFNSSMKILRMRMKWTKEDVTRGILGLLRANNTRADVHIRPTVYFGSGEDYGFDPEKIEVGCVITTAERPIKPSLWSGITVCVSSWRRIDDEAMPPRVKSGANYLNSRYAVMEAKLGGFDSAIILNRAGKVAEGPGACVMMVRGGRLVTPPVTAGTLDSITRSTLIDLCRRELGMEVEERDIDRTELYVAEELFFCGTGLEVQPITSVDRYEVGIGQTGPAVKAIQEVYFNIARGGNPKYGEWLTPVY